MKNSSAATLPLCHQTAKMLSPRDKDFIRYWEANRVRRKKIGTQFLIGIPIGLLFVIPIVINFSSGWYKRADMEANSSDFNPMVLFVALLLILGFTAIFYQRYKWDQYEQHYRELLAREEKDQPPSPEQLQRPGPEGSPDETKPREDETNTPKTE
jgi:hypothetical protein